MSANYGHKDLKRFSIESTLFIMAEHIKGRLPRTSCHTQVAEWVQTKEDLEPDDEIVLFGRTVYENVRGQKTDVPNPTVMHSLIMRNNEILCDPFRGGKFDAETQIYQVNDETLHKDWQLKELHRVSLIDFLKDHAIIPPDYDAPDPYDEPGF